jgi:uncharacterized membrane protein YfcA
MLIIIGIIIGLVMGLTGAGGALIAIPLFMQFLKMSLKEASVYSLMAVVIASLSNFYHQRKDAKISLAVIFVVSSAIGSFVSLPYKSLIPDLGIASILAMIAIYSLYSVWIPHEKMTSLNQQKINHFKTIFIGFILGILTTFTGLGGGVLMLPILLGIYKLPQHQAVATSLVVVGFSSLSSFLIQASRGISVIIDARFLALLAGILVTSYLLKLLTSKLSTEHFEMLGKIIFTLVVGISLAKIF